MPKDLINKPEFIGKNLKLLRTIKQLQLNQVARSTGISNAYLSLIEHGKRKAPPELLRSILNIYDYSLALFLSQIDIEETQQTEEIVTQSKSLLLEGDLGDNKYQLLLKRKINSKDELEILEMFIPAGMKIPEKKWKFDAEIRGIVLSGKLLLAFEKNEFSAGEGEDFLFDGNLLHSYRNLEDFPCKLNLMIRPAVF